MTARKMLATLAGWMGAITIFFSGVAGIALWIQFPNLPFFSMTGNCILSLVLQIGGGLTLGTLFLWAIWPDVKEILIKNIEPSKEKDNS